MTSKVLAGVAAVAAAWVIAIHPGADFLHIPPVPRPQPVTIVFVGDLMFDRGVARHASIYGVDTLLSGAKPFLAGNDLVVGNLEGTITTNKPVAVPGGSVLHFTFDPKFAALLREAGFDIVSQANNHALDFYQAGFKSTEAYLDAAGIGHFGSPYNNVQISTSTVVRGKRLCFVGYHDLYTYDAAPATAEIARVRPECDFVTVFAHWGEEYKLAASPRQKKLAHEWINAGADLVIGAHPHVVEPVEIYQGKAIFYSLGNFVFDQAFSYWVQHGLAVKVLLYDDRAEFELVPTTIDKAEVSAAGSDDAAKVLQVAGVPDGRIVIAGSPFTAPLSAATSTNP